MNIYHDFKKKKLNDTSDYFSHKIKSLSSKSTPHCLNIIVQERAKPHIN